MLKYVSNEIKKKKNLSAKKRASELWAQIHWQSGSPTTSPAAGLAAKPGPRAPRGTGPLPCQAGSQSMCRGSSGQVMDRTGICSQLSVPCLFAFPANTDTCLFGNKEQEKKISKKAAGGTRGKLCNQLSIKKRIVVLVDWTSAPSLPTPRQSLCILSIFKTMWSQPGLYSASKVRENVYRQA